ncbi:hypothetical protein GCM10020254_09170 [Streptomyces goshikiensis]
MEVGHGFAVQSQRPGDGFEHLLRRVAFAALLQARVVVGAHPGERRDLFAAQAGHPAAAGRGKPGVLGAEPGPACAQEHAQRVLVGGVLACVHVPRLGGGGGWPCP